MVVLSLQKPKMNFKFKGKRGKADPDAVGSGETADKAEGGKAGHQLPARCQSPAQPLGSPRPRDVALVGAQRPRGRGLPSGCVGD